jgi:uncharacterized protein YndB with AHSA1/START domain
MEFVIDRTIEVNAPATAVWQAITDLPRYGEWNPFCLAARSTLKPGETIEMTVQLTSKPQKVVEWMKEFVPGLRFAYSMKPIPLGALSSLRSHEVEPLGNGRARYRSYFELKGWMMPLVRALYGPNLERGFGSMTEAVGRRSEELAKEGRR